MPKAHSVDTRTANIFAYAELFLLDNEQLAKALKCAKSDIIDVRNGKQDFTNDDVIKLADLMNLNTQEFRNPPSNNESIDLKSNKLIAYVYNFYRQHRYSADSWEQPKDGSIELREKINKKYYNLHVDDRYSSYGKGNMRFAAISNHLRQCLTDNTTPDDLLIDYIVVIRKSTREAVLTGEASIVNLVAGANKALIAMEKENLRIANAKTALEEATKRLHAVLDDERVPKNIKESLRASAIDLG